MPRAQATPKDWRPAEGRAEQGERRFQMERHTVRMYGSATVSVSVRSEVEK